MKMIYYIFFFLIIISFPACSSDNANDKIESEFKAERAAIINEFAKSHSAFAYKEALENSESDQFSFEKQRALLSSSLSHPLIIDGLVVDVYDHAGKLFIEIDGLPATFRLSLDSNMANKLKKSKLKKYNVVAAIARITSVDKATKIIEPSGEELEVSLHDKFIICGECLDFMLLPKKANLPN